MKLKLSLNHYFIKKIEPKNNFVGIICCDLSSKIENNGLFIF